MVPWKGGHLRMVKPPRPVWINLALAYPIPGDPPVILEDGLDLRSVVPGTLLMWNRASTGQWVGWVAFRLRGDRGSARVSQWILADALRPRADTV